MTFKLSLAASKDKVYNHCGKVTLPKAYTNRYQINPGQKLNCILGINDSRMYTIEWGLIPDWSSTLKNRGVLTEINASGAINKPSSRIPFRLRRGYVLVDGIYYIRKLGRRYIPYRIERRDGQLMKLACIWDEWKKDNQYLATCALLTQPVDNFISPTLPIELTEQKDLQWLHHEDINFLDRMINESVRTDVYKSFKVSEKLLDNHYNSQDLYEPKIEELTLFSEL